MEYEYLSDREKKERDRLYELSKPLSEHNQPERSKREDLNNGFFYLGSGALNSMET